VGQNLKGIDVVAVMERIKASRGVVPQRIQVDNGSEFISKALTSGPTTTRDAGLLGAWKTNG